MLDTGRRASMPADSLTLYHPLSLQSLPEYPSMSTRHMVGMTRSMSSSHASVGSLAGGAGGGLSRPSTRSNTLSNADAHSRSASRANSLDAAMSLSLSLDGLGVLASAASEFGETTPSSATSTSYSVPFGLSVNGSRSTGTSSSYHTAMSVRPESIEEGS